jgi:hypothetical protein
MKKYLLALLIILFTGTIFIVSGTMQSVSGDTFTGQLEPPIEHETFEDLIGAIISFIFTIALVLAPLLIIIGGFYFVAAAGDAKKIETGKRIILYTLIGFLIILISRGLVEVIKGLIKVVD